MAAAEMLERHPCGGVPLAFPREAGERERRAVLGNPLAETNGAHKVAGRMRTAKRLKLVAFPVSIVWGLYWPLFFVASNALEGTGGWAAVRLIAPYAVPMVLLALVAWFRPAIGLRLLLILLVPAGVLWVVTSVVAIVVPELVWDFLRFPLDRIYLVVGQDLGFVMFLLLVALPSLGGERPLLAGALLVALAVLHFADLAILLPAEFPVLLGFWMVPFGLPALLFGILFLVSGSLAGERLRLGR